MTSCTVASRHKHTQDRCWLCTCLSPLYTSCTHRCLLPPPAWAGEPSWPSPQLGSFVGTFEGAASEAQAGLRLREQLHAGAMDSVAPGQSCIWHGWMHPLSSAWAAGHPTGDGAQRGQGPQGLPVGTPSEQAGASEHCSPVRWQCRGASPCCAGAVQRCPPLLCWGSSEVPPLLCWEGRGAELRDGSHSTAQMCSRVLSRGEREAQVRQAQRRCQVRHRGEGSKMGARDDEDDRGCYEGSKSKSKSKMGARVLTRRSLNGSGFGTIIPPP